MRLFLEFFTFELKFRFKSDLHLRLLRHLVRLQLPLHRLRELWPYRRRQRQGAAQRTVREHVQRCLLYLLRPDHHRRHLRHLDPSRLSARHHQILFTKPISKFAYLGGRWAGSFVTTVFAFSGLLFGELLGTLAPWADHTRIAPTTCGGISSRSSPSSSSRSSSLARSSSWSPRLPAGSSSFTCRARPF